MLMYVHMNIINMNWTNNEVKDPCLHAGPVLACLNRTVFVVVVRFLLLFLFTLVAFVVALVVV